MIILKIIEALLYISIPITIFLIWIYLAAVNYHRIGTIVYLVGTLSILYLHDKLDCNDLGCEPNIWFFLFFIPVISFIYLVAQIIVLLFNIGNYRDDYMGKNKNTK